MSTKNDDWDGHKEVKDLISRVPELRKIKSRFEKIETEYKDKPYDNKCSESSDQNDSFDDILWNFVYYRHDLKKELDERPFTGITIKEEIFENAKKYLNSKYLHTPYLTNAILIQVIDTELVPLEYEVDGIAHPILRDIATRLTFGPMAPVKYTNLLPYPWNKLVSFGLSLIFLVIGIIAIIFFVSVNLNWLAWIIGILFAWNYIGKIFLSIDSTKTKSKLAVLGRNFRIIRDEINSNSYDGKVLADRMKKLENDGLYVHSLVYPLLELSIKNKST